MGDSPAVLYLGGVINEGYDFHWYHGQHPVLIHCETQNQLVCPTTLNVPTIVAGVEIAPPQRISGGCSTASSESVEPEGNDHELVCPAVGNHELDKSDGFSRVKTKRRGRRTSNKSASPQCTHN